MPAPAQPQQPLLDRRPARQSSRRHGGEARQVVEDEELEARELRLELGLHRRPGEIADAAVDEIAGEHCEQVGRVRDPLPATMPAGARASAAAGISPSTSRTRRGLRRLPGEEAAAGRDRMGDAERDVGLADAARGIEHRQPVLRDDRIEHHAARLDGKREQLGEIEQAQARRTVAALLDRRHGGEGNDGVIGHLVHGISHRRPAIAPSPPRAFSAGAAGSAPCRRRARGSP